MKERESVDILKGELRYVDMNFLFDLVMENVEFMRNVLRQFLKQFPGEMESLKEAVALHDNKRVASLAHHIQSTVSVLGKKTPFFEHLENLEKTALKKASSQQLTNAFNSLNEHKQLLMRDIDRLMKAEIE
jgi:HPt (histidine-containing phosphotransfer) domain-containing protein